MPKTPNKDSLKKKKEEEDEEEILLRRIDWARDPDFLRLGLVVSAESVTIHQLKKIKKINKFFLKSSEIGGERGGD